MSEVTKLERCIYQRFLKHHAALREVARRRRSEIKQLRQALEEIQSESAPAGYDFGNSKIHEIARRALRPTGQSGI